MEVVLSLGIHKTSSPAQHWIEAMLVWSQAMEAFNFAEKAIFINVLEENEAYEVGARAQVTVVAKRWYYGNIAD